MIPTSMEYKREIRENQKVIASATVRFSDSTTLELNGDDFIANTFGITDSTTQSGSFQIGSAIINTFSCSLNNTSGKFDAYDFSKAKIVPRVGKILSNTTEWIKRGNFTIDKPTTIGSTVVITALDNMSKFEVDFKNVTQTFPCTLSTLLHTVCQYCGVSLATSTFDNSSYTVSERPSDENLICLDIVSCIAQISGNYARCNMDGALELKWYDKTFTQAPNIDGGTFDTNTTPYSDGANVDGGNFTDYTSGASIDGGTFEDLADSYSIYAFNNYSVGTDEITITGLRIADIEKNETAYGADGYVLKIENNVLIESGKSATVGPVIASKIVGLKFRPFKCTALNDPSIEAGDSVVIVDSKGNAYITFINNLSYKAGNYESFSCEAETISENNAKSYSAITKAVDKLREDNTRQLTDYDKAVVNMNMLAINSLGYYMTETSDMNDARITYIHDRPLLAGSTVIYKMTSAGFFLSTNGGATYTAGFDSSGNAIFNIVHAIGIVCDWIKGGTLTLGGMDNVDGLLRVLLADGITEAVKADKSGLHAIAGQIGGFNIYSDYLGTSYSETGTAGIKMVQSNGNIISWKPQYQATIAPGVLKINTGAVDGKGVTIYNTSYGTSGNYSRLSHSALSIVGSDEETRAGAGSVQVGTSSQNALLDKTGVAVSSDYRLKENIKIIDGSILNFMEEVDPKEFAYKFDAEGRKHFGFIAQEVVEKLQKFRIFKTQIATKHGSGYYTLNITEFIPMLFKGWQDNRNRIKALEERVRILEERQGD